MPTPTDRGYAFITSKPDGATIVRVAAEVTGGAPVGVYAEHVGVAAVSFASDVRVVERGGTAFTPDTVEVFGDDDGVVHIARVGTTSLGG